MAVTDRLSDEQIAALHRDGFVRLAGFVDAAVGQTMLARVIELARAAADGQDISPSFVTPEQQPDLGERPAPEDLVSKIFRLARDPVFHDFITLPEVTALAAPLIGTDDLDCFLSQFIFKNPGAWGQPWHQDSFYFPFDPARPIVGLWLAVTEATLDNGCLQVVPGSHLEPVHRHIPDARPGANYGYVEIVDYDMAEAVPVLMMPGDLLVFDSHLMHRSTDNVSGGLRAAMVFHIAAAGTADHTIEQRGYTVNDWIPVRRAEGTPMTPSIDEIVVGDEPESWRAAGFAVDPDGTCRIGTVRFRLIGRQRGKRILEWSLRDIDPGGLTDSGLDGLPTTVSETDPAEPASHPNGVRSIDHIVLISPDTARTTAALEAVGFDVRKVRETDSYGAPMRQTFFRAAEVIIELVGPEEPGEGSTAFFGLAHTVDDLDATAAFLGPGMGAPKDAVQPGRRIASLRHKDLDISVATALMTPEPA